VKLIESPEVDLDELADAVNGDPVLATRIMGVANSTYFRGVTEVPNVREALMRMGVREARTIVVVVALRSTVLRSPGLGDYARELWRHSILSALVTQEITSELPPWQSTGFLAGLLHDLGKLVVLAFVSELPAWQEDGAEPSQSTIDAINDATHASLGAMVLDSWGFPQRFCDAIMAHEHSEEAAEDVASLAAAVELGHHLARQIDAGWPDDS
jgi:putative nucleotidyltransferase with HDIG domain